jgi:2-dehydropantoate 2-reductase
MKIAIMGAGGVGGYYGALLARKNHDVTFLARGAHLQAIQTRGLQIRSRLGDFLIQPAQATNQPAQVGPVDLVLFCVKAYDTAVAAVEAQPLVGPGTTVLSLQNGLDAHEQLGSAFGTQHVIAGATGIIAYVESPGKIRMDSKAPWVTVGELDGRLTPRVQAVGDAFREAGVEVEVSERILAVLWSKLMIVAPLAGFGSLIGLPVGEFRSVPDEAALESNAVRETLEGMDGLPHDWRSSMQRDVEAGHRAELEAIIGVIGRKGRQLGVPTPVADMLYGALLPMDLQRRGG